MMRHNNPVIVATQRTGSTLICWLLHEIARRQFKHKGMLGEYFDVDPKRQTDYVVDELSRIIQGNTRRLDTPWWTTQRELEEGRARKLDMLKKCGNHTFKIFPDHFSNAIISYLKNNYDFVYLERRDKKQQMLSVMAMHHYKTAHYYKNNYTVIGKFNFDPLVYKYWYGTLLKYEAIKQTQPGIVLYYEDFINAGGDIRALISLLKLTGCEDIPNPAIPSRPSLYQYSNDECFLNPGVWDKFKSEVEDQLKLLYRPL